MPATEESGDMVSSDFPAASHRGMKTLRAIGVSWVIPLDRDPRESSRPFRQAASGSHSKLKRGFSALLLESRDTRRLPRGEGLTLTGKVCL